MKHVDPETGKNSNSVNHPRQSEPKQYMKNFKIVRQKLKEIEEKEKLIADLDAFDHTVAHDLNNIIGAIVTSTDLLYYEVEQQNYANLEEVIELIQAEVDKANKKFARVETIKKFRLIDIQLTTDDDEITPTGKLKRNFVSEKFKEEIDSMY